MNIYTNEFIKFIDKAENALADTFVGMAENYGSDSMIAIRNLSVGDSNDFGDGDMVVLMNYTVDVRDVLHFLSRKSESEVERMLCRSLKWDVEQRVEEAFSQASLKISNLEDVRKVMRIAIDSDVIIHMPEFKMTYKMGIGFRKNG